MREKDKIQRSDVRFEGVGGGGPTWQWYRATHLPSGTVVEVVAPVDGERSENTKARLMHLLEFKLLRNRARDGR